MQRVLSNELWKVIRSQARKARQRKAAVAYVTRDLLGFRRGDELVLDASAHAISSGETSAPLLRTLLRRGVSLYHCADLHAKVLLFGDKAVVGSGNMSDSSANVLVEAGILSDHASIVSGVASLIEQLVQQSEPLDKKRVNQLCKIKVVRRGGRAAGRGKRRTSVKRLGNQTWLIGVWEMVREPRAVERILIKKAAKTLKLAEEKFEWVRWSGKSRFIRECREGDSLVQIWRPHRGAKHPTVVLQARPVLLKQRTKHWTRFYYEAAAGRRSEMPWRVFKQLVRRLGYPKQVGPNIAQLLEPEMADAIARNWKTSKAFA
jgi:hypothetical protein